MFLAVHRKQSDWKTLAERMATGSTVVFLSPKHSSATKTGRSLAAFSEEGSHLRVLMIGSITRNVLRSRIRCSRGCREKECFDWYYYGPVWPHYLFDGQETPSK